MPLINTNMTMFKGDSKTLDITVQDKNMTPINLTGASIRMTVKKVETLADTTALFKKSNAAGQGITVTDAAGGLFRIEINPADTLGKASGGYYFDVQLKTQAQKVYTLVKGQLRIDEDVTKDY